MAASTNRGPLDPGPDDREAALAARWRRLREGVVRTATAHTDSPRIITPSITAWPPT